LTIFLGELGSSYRLLIIKLPSSRFILNLPDGELASLERICFQVEQAYDSCRPTPRSLTYITLSLQGIGIMKISFEKKIPDSHHYLSKSSPRCFSRHALSLSAGEAIMTAHSTTLCDTRPECPSVVQLCSTMLGIRSDFTPFSRNHRFKLCAAGGACERLEVLFGMGFPEREDQPERTTPRVCCA
jgi:Dcp2, box A domain